MIHAEPCIVFDDGGLIALDKPPGLLSTGRQRDDADSAEGWLRASLGREVWALHQLDRDTSGLLLFVTRRTLVEPWQRRLAHRRTHKRYLAVVHGEPTFSRARLDAPLGRDEARGRIIVTSAGKPALSLVRVRARRDGFALVEVRLETGRTHQVRVHLAHAGHPLVGESVYRVPPSDRHPRQALHAFELCVADGPRLRAPLPQDLLTLLAELGLRDAADINDGN